MRPQVNEQGWSPHVVGNSKYTSQDKISSMTQSAQDRGVIMIEAPSDTSDIMCDATRSCFAQKSLRRLISL